MLYDVLYVTHLYLHLQVNLGYLVIKIYKM